MGRQEKKKRLLEKSIVIALSCGILLTGGTGAAAGSVASDWDDDVVISSGTMTVDTFFSEADAAGNPLGYNIGAGKITLQTGGKLEIKDAGRLIGYNKNLFLDMQGGDLAITSSATANQIASIDAGTVRIAGGKAVLTGNTGNAWNNGAYIGGYEGFTLAAGAVEMNKNSMIFIGTSDAKQNVMRLEGGTILMTGEASTLTTPAEADLGAYGSNAAHLWSGSGALLSGRQDTRLELAGTAITVGDGSTENYGVISSHNTVMSGGSITVKGKGHLLLQANPFSPKDSGQNIVYEGAGAGTFAMTDGNITVEDKGRLDSKVRIHQSGGTVAVDGSVIAGEGSSYIVENGAQVTVSDTGYLEAGNLAIHGGTVNIGNEQDSSWADASSMGGYGMGNNDTTVVDGGTINLGNSGTLFAGVSSDTFAAGTNGAFNIGGDAVINMNGTTDATAANSQDSVLFAAGVKEGSGGHVTLNIGENAKVNVAAGKGGYILSRETNLKDHAQWNVNGKLVIAAGALKNDSHGDSYTAAEGLDVATAKGGKFTLSGDAAIHVADTGSVDFAAGEIDTVMQGGTIDLAGNGKVYFHDLTYKSGSGLANGDLSLGDDSAKIGVQGDLSVQGDLTLNKITQADSSNLKVDHGSALTVGTLEQTGTSSAYAAVGGASSGTLKITEGLKNQAYASATPKGLLIDNMGTLEADKSLLFNDGLTALQTGVNKIGVAVGGTVKVNGIATITTAEINTIKGALIDGNTGLFDLGNADITDLTTTGQTIAVGDVIAGVTSDKLQTLTVTDVTTETLSGGFKGVQLGAATNSLEVGELLLSGDKSHQNLIAKEDGTVGDATVKEGVLTLGKADKDHSGAIGSVTLGDTSNKKGTLNAVGNGAASFTTGDILVASGGTGEVNVSGAKLTTGAVGASGAEVAALHVTNGALSAGNGGDQDVVVTALTLQNGSISGKDITVTDKIATMKDGAMFASGDVTLTGGADKASGYISGENITATGQDIIGDGKLTLLAKDTIAAANVKATSLAAGTLTASGNVELANGVLALGAGDSTIGTGGAGDLKLSDSVSTVGSKLTVEGDATVSGGTLQAKSLEIKGDAAFKDGAAVSVETLKGASGKTIAVGAESDAQGVTMTVGALDLNDGKLLIDPAWGSAPNQVAVNRFVGGVGDVGVGRNSMLVIGDADTDWLEGQIGAATGGKGISESGVTAALGLKTAQVLASGKSMVLDGAKTSAGLNSAFSANTLQFGANSMLVVDSAAALSGAGAISAAAASTADIGSNAKLRLVNNVKVGDTYKVLGDNITAAYADDSAWNGDNLSTDWRMITLNRGATAGTFTTGLTSASAVFPDLSDSLAATLDNLYTGRKNDVNAADGGVRFLSRATNDGFLGNDSRAAAATIESAARMASIGAVPQMTLSVLDAAVLNVQQRTSFAATGNGRMTSVKIGGEDQVADGKGGSLWMTPLYQKQKMDDLDAGKFGYDWDGHIGGAAFGMDYAFAGGARAGLNFSIGSGSADGSGNLNTTRNDLDFWGIGAYANWQKDKFNLTADFNYAKTANDLKQYLPGVMGMDALRAEDVKGSAFSLGVRGEYKIEKPNMDIIPHFGIRYTHLTTDGFDVKSGGTILSSGSTTQNLWTFPIGVTFTKSIQQKNGWSCKPSLDLSIIPAAGDLDSESKVRFTGLDGAAMVSTQIMDNVTYMGNLGVEFSKDRLSLGLNYNIQTSGKTRNQGVYGMVRVAF